VIAEVVRVECDKQAWQKRFNPMKITLIVLHSITALFGIVACILLYDASPGSHPPAIVFLPIAIVIWIALHIILGVIQWLEAIYSKRRKGGGSSAPWPILLIAAVILYLPGMIKALGYLLSAFSLPMWWTVNHTITACILLFKLTVLVSIFLRLSWGRFLAGGGFILMGVFSLIIYFSGILDGYKFEIQQLMVLGRQIPILSLGVLILVSPSIKAFFGVSAADQETAPQ
jgi:hypothetical protein